MVDVGEITGVEVARVRLSGSVVKGVGVLEYFDTHEKAEERRDDILLEAPRADLELEQVICYLDDDGEVLAELEK